MDQELSTIIHEVEELEELENSELFTSEQDKQQGILELDVLKQYGF